MASKALKILVAGDVRGDFATLFKRINSILKKNGQFDMLLCVGEFFNGDDSEQEWNKYISGELKVPIQTYLLGPCSDENIRYFSDIDGCELCSNVTYLGKKGRYTGSSGLQIAYLSGTDAGTDSNTTGTFSRDDVQSLAIPLTSDSKFKGVDILLTSQWSKGVERYAANPDGICSDMVGSTAISQLAIALKPRYHFVGLTGCHYERQPYRNHKVLVDNAKHVTRYISLAEVGNKQKKKFLYAFNIVPMASMDVAELVKQPDDVTECPYIVDHSAPPITELTEDTGPQYFFNTKSQDGSQRRGKKRYSDQFDKKPPKKQPQATGPCWFCLGSPQVEKHLVVSVGDYAYIALAKGGLTGEHVLVTPIGHHQSLTSAPDEVINEINKYKSSLKKCFKQQDKGVVFFERNYKTQHLQVQAVPVDWKLVDELKDHFIESAQNHPQSFELHEIPKLSDIKQIVPLGAPYFYVELPNGEKLLHRIKKFFPLQFGREVMASTDMLDMPDRAEWKNCITSKPEETSTAQAFRELFEPFDFTT